MLDSGWQRLVDILVLPPGGILLLVVLALVLWPRRLGRTVLVLAALLYWAAATPVVSSWLLWSLEDAPPLRAERYADAPATAIVILSGDLQRDAAEYGGDTVGGLTLERLRYGARLAKDTRLPVLVSGGVLDERASLAALMKDALERDFGVKARWVEDRSRTTWENAELSAELLRRDGIGRVLLVTHAWHMRRSVLSFRPTGLEIVPAPTLAYAPGPLELEAFLPMPNSFRRSYFALHEIAGLAWYRMRAAL
jgi:uncharacterized SAM-binding protein YcdF (DUF218 family)